MTVRDSLTYFDRESGKLMTEPVYAARFLHWSYNTSLGRLATDVLFSQEFISRLYGWIHKRRWSRRKIRHFVESMNVDLGVSLRPIDDFASFNDFFTREIDLAKRPIQPEPGVCISPTDGRVLAHPVIDADSSFRIKRNMFNLRRFLCDDGLARKFSGGSLVISRLYLSDYHHFHFPDSGIPGPARSIRGRYYAVGPYSLRSLVPFFTENHRVMTLFGSDHFGQIAMVEVGAFTVGSIQQCYRPEVRVAKGDRKGYFQMGGSTVVLLFERGAIQLDDDLCANTEAGIETYVRLGESIGRT